MAHKITVLLLYLACFNTYSQSINKVDLLLPDTEFENTHVKSLASDSLASSFAIWVRLKVKRHKHVFHTENVYVLEGTGNFSLGDSTFSIAPGDYLTIPKNTWHGVEVTSEKPLKVISVQSPKFIGKDRVFDD